MYGASFVAAVSTQEKLCLKFGADQVIDYRTKVPEFERSKFDTVFDLVSGDNWTVELTLGKQSTVVEAMSRSWQVLIQSSSPWNNGYHSIELSNHWTDALVSTQSLYSQVGACRWIAVGAGGPSRSI